MPPAADGAWVHRGRDEHELALLAAARTAALPVLGVCRGLQLANVALGGDLVEHVDGHDAGARFAADLHPVRVDEGTLLARATGGGELAVNSLHHQVVGSLARGLRAERERRRRAARGRRGARRARGSSPCSGIPS